MTGRATITPYEPEITRISSINISMARQASGLRSKSFKGYMAAPTPRPEADSAKEVDSFLSQVLSIRVILVCITILTVISMGIGLIVVSVHAQMDIVDDLSARIQQDVSTQIEYKMTDIFKYVEDELDASRLLYQTSGIEYPPTMGENPFEVWPTISEHLWSIVRKRPEGLEVEFEFFDGRFFGMESYSSQADIFWVDLVDDLMFEAGWIIELNQTVDSVNTSYSNAFGVYTFPTNNTSLYPSVTFVSCTSPAEWFDLHLFMQEHIGNMAVSVGLNRNIFEVYDDGSSMQKTIFNSNETWIQDVVKLMNGNYGNQERLVHVNNTEYNQFNGIDWYVVKLLERRQFLGNSKEYFVKSVGIATVVTAVSIAIVIMISWGMTNPLFILAGDLQKMSRLDFSVSDMSTPRLLEVSKLYRSVASMYIALQSFKKFVPVQVISKIIASEREVTAELLPAKVTIVFQDIEGFTSISETMDPVALAKLTKDMVTMTEIICKHGGTIDKYIGDCIMSLFNVPDEVDHHPLAATRAAVECMKALAVKNIEWRAQYGVVLNCRTGINTGDVLVGNMGGDYRMNYTAFGDNVNVAARLEGVNKHFGTRIIVSKSVFTTFPENVPFFTRKLGKVRVSGKSRPTSIYEVRGELTATTKQVFALYRSALNSFKSQDFGLALSTIQEARVCDPQDRASRQLEERLEEVIRTGEGGGQWSYVEDLRKL